MPKRDPRVRLLHMRDYSLKAIAMTQCQSREDLEIDEKLRFALTHVVELISEAASQVPLKLHPIPEIWIMSDRIHLKNCL